MNKGLGFTMVLGIAVCLGAAQATFADYYDEFNDGHYWQDPNDEPFDSSIGYWPWYNTPPYAPNVYDIDNPHWGIVALMGTNYLADAGDGWLRLYAEMDWLPNFFIGAAAIDNDTDPNTSTTYFDDSAPHYILAKFKVYDPNRGEILVFMHADATNWTGWGADIELEYKDGNPLQHNEFTATHFNATDWHGQGNQFRNELDTKTGVWMICQFVGDGDPNHSRIKVAAWNGDKYDWDGFWDIDLGMTTAWDPNRRPYWSQGICGVATLGSPQCGSPLDVDAKFDGIECRWGTFTNVARTLQINVVKPNYGSVTIDPDLRHPSDPNTAEEKLCRYTNGTSVALLATPISGKAFGGWAIWADPNRYPDANYAVLDANAVAYLTMDKNYVAEATFKCGSGLEPLVGIALLALMLGALIRRMT